MTRCPNCNQKFQKQKDRTYSLCFVHYYPTCPYRFEAAAHTKKQLNINIRGIYERYGYRR